MKVKVLSLITLLFANGCATGGRDSARILNSDKDLLAVESLQRLSPAALDRFAENDKFKGNVACYRGKVEDGLTILRSQLHERRKDPLYWNGLAVCYIKKGDLSKAKFYIETGLALVKNDFLTQGILENNIAIIQMKRGHKLIAYDLFGASIEKGVSAARYNRLHLALQEEWFDQFEKDFAIMNRVSSNDPDLLFTRALKHIYDNKIEEALKILTELPSREEVDTYKAFCLFLLDNPKEAKDILHKVAFFDSYDVKKFNLQLRKEAKIAEDLKNEQLKEKELRKIASEKRK